MGKPKTKRQGGEGCSVRVWDCGLQNEEEDKEMKRKVDWRSCALHMIYLRELGEDQQPRPGK